MSSDPADPNVAPAAGGEASPKPDAAPTPAPATPQPTPQEIEAREVELDREAAALGVQRERPVQDEALPVVDEPAQPGPQEGQPGSTGGSKPAVTVADAAKAAAAEALKKLGIKVPEGAAKPADAAGQDQPKPEGQPTLAEEVEKAINPDGKTPLETQLASLKKLYSDGQTFHGEQSKQLGALRSAFQDFQQKGWFEVGQDGRAMPNMLNIAKGLPDAVVIEQLQKGAGDLQRMGYKLVPLSEATAAASANPLQTAREKIAAALVPDKDMSHAERMKEIRESTELEEKFDAAMDGERAALMRAENQKAGESAAKAQQQAIERQQQETAVVARVQAEAKELGDLWPKLAPSLERYGRELPTDMDARMGIEFALARAKLDLVPDLMNAATASAYEAGFKAAQEQAGLVIPQAGAAAAKRTGSSGGGVATPEEARFLGIDVVAG